MTAEEVFESIRPNLPFIRGITTSGGECALYPRFLTELFSLAKEEGLTTLMDTNGTVDLSTHPELLSVTDGVMLDIKAWDEGVFEHLTGYRPTGALPVNLRHLTSHGKLEEVRLVCQAQWVDIHGALEGVKETIPEHIGTIRLKLIAFRAHGVKGRMKETPMPTTEEMTAYAAYARELGFGNVVLR
jgi:pyruvate formate lyase activating enzyme